MHKKGTKKTVVIFSLASFLNDLGSDMIYPIWPLFVTTALGAPMTILGLIDGLGEALVSISQAISGYFSDKIRKRKVFVWSGYLFGAISRIGYGLSESWQSLALFKILDRGGKIRGAPRDAIIADISSKEERGKNFGFLRAMDHLGAVCGILICILLFNSLGFRKLFFLAAIPSVISALLVFLLVKERTTDTKIFKGLRFKDLNKNFKLLLISSSLFSLASFSYSFLLVYAKKFGVKIGSVPVLYLEFTIVASIFSYPFGRLADKIGRKIVLIVSYVIWAIMCGISIFIQTYFAILLMFFLYGLHRGALEPVQRAFVSELAPAKYRASVLGGFQMIVGLCALPSSLIAGVLWDRFNVFAPFYFSLGISTLSLFVLLFINFDKN